MIQKSKDRAHVELVTVYEIGKILGSSLELKRTFREALNVLSAHLGLVRCMIVLKHESGELHLFSAVGLAEDEAQRARFMVGEGVIGRVFSTGMPCVLPDIDSEPLFLNRTQARAAERGRLAFVAVPLKAGAETLGVLCADRRTDLAMGPLSEDARVLSMVATLVAQAVVMQKSVAEERAQLLQETRRLQRDLRGRFSLERMVGVSKRMQEVFAEVHLAAPGKASVLLRGESGTGKEAVARAIHYLSPRKAAPFVKVNCAALSETLLESELFGHEKGAFTGAHAERKGRFELADGGTLFLDEIGDISLAFQAKLLRVLQEREFERVGGSRQIKVNVRIVSATNRNLEKMVERGEYRSDLYYRINVVGIFLPPLRERREDIPPLAAHFLERFNRENNRQLRFHSDAMKLLTNCFWPGNVRELENCIERTATMTTGDTIAALNFPCHNSHCLSQALHRVEPEGALAPARTIPIRVAPPPAEPPAPAEGQAGPPEKPQSERDRLIWALEQCGWVQAKAARLLNITPRQMGYALQKHGIEVRKF